MNDRIKEEVNNALEVLKSGGVIVYPTDTIWGIGCDATNPEAVKKVFDIKQRIDSKSLIVLLDNPDFLPDYVKEVPEIAWELIDAASSPLTIIYEGATRLAPNVIAEDGSIAIRIVGEPFCQALLRRFRKPITSTSANISGFASPKHFGEIDEQILKQADYVVNLRQEEISGDQASSIIKLFENGRFEIIRK